jgi:uncharacterized membrane protein
MSGYMSSMMVLMSKGIPLIQLVNINYLSAEVLKTVVGSLGLVTVAPFTSVIGGFLFLRFQSTVVESTATPVIRLSLQENDGR